MPTYPAHVESKFRNDSSFFSPAEKEYVIEKLPQQEIPAPKIKMKTINWNKIPKNKVVGKNNVWTQVAFRHQHSPLADMDWKEMEDLFCQQAPPSSPKLGHRGSPDERRIRKETQEITLLDGKRSLNINIFLKQFRSSNEDVIQLIKNGEHYEIGTEKLKGLLKILPEVDELDMLKSFNGDFNRLGNAEKFLIQLTSLSNYKLRIESMLLKEEFAANMGYLEPSINSMVMAAQDLMTNKPLQEVLYMVLIAGNFLNSGGYAGDAAGVKLTSLQKITDIRANKPNMNLIHFVALQAEKKNKLLLSFAENISVLEDAAKTTVEQLYNEIEVLDGRIKKIKKQIDLPTTESEIKYQMTDFLIVAEHEVSKLQKEMKTLEDVRKQLSEFFCEDPNSFKIEECFRVFHSFCYKFKQAVAENERRRIQEEQANARRKQREEILATKRRQMESLGTPDSDGPFIDMQIYDARTCYSKKGRKANNSSGVSEDEMSVTSSPSLSRRRLGSFNGNRNTDNSSKEDKSPDTTPNGSLRRRRSRVLSEEDEGNLMEFLRASGNENHRERKSWGSLDRSWARKSRGGSRKRPALLAADFSSERERPSSPSPLTENKMICQSAPEPEYKPKEWRQKIESWLQTSESDQGSEDQKRQGRRLINRKSLEMESESERSSTLDTLPEGKQVYSGSQSDYRKVNPAWQPSSTLDNMNIVDTMEIVEEVQPQVKDKSAWRKSTLNVANSTEETKEEGVRSRHGSSKAKLSTPEDSERKEFINSLAEKSVPEKLTLYIRKPPERSDGATTSQLSNLGQVPSRIRDSQLSIDSSVSSNKIEIDQDNIETPPATRKIIIPTPVEKREPVQPSLCKRMLGKINREDNGDNGTSFGDGQFDRFSATRRTRRYRRTPDASETPSPTEQTFEPPQTTSPPAEPSKSSDVDSEKQREARLKAWQSKAQHQDDSSQCFQDAYGRRGKRARNLTGIARSDSDITLQLSTSDQNVLKDFISPGNIKVGCSSTKIDIPSRKNRETDKDEGFEETQSLMSESPSQGASSSGANCDNDIAEAPQILPSGPKVPQASAVSKASATGSKKLETSQKQPAVKPKKALARSASVNEKSTSDNKRNPTRTKAIDTRKTAPKTSSPSTKSAPVQKSSSRNSIVSSRSSLNSATSSSTVKQLPLKQGNASATSQYSFNSKTNPPNGTKIVRKTSSASSTGTRPPKPQSMSFMKPTTSSYTRMNSREKGGTQSFRK